MQARKNLRAWIKLDAFGFIIPGTLTLRPYRNMPKDGRWVQVRENYCCADMDNILIVSNTTAASNILSVQSSDNSTNWTGTLSNGQTIAFVIPNGYDETFTVTTSTFSGRTITTSVLQGTGTISAVGALTSNTTTFTTSATPGSQFQAVLS